MANDFKRMWTKEELKDTYVLKLDDWDYTENYDAYGFSKEQLDSISNFDKVLVIDNRGWGLLFIKQRIEKYGNVIYEMIDNNSNYLLSLGYDETPNFYVSISRIELVVGNQYESLVSATPTDVSIIEDQGKLELMLEHDGNVLAINDTPNQFLQRNLDKPAFRWTDNDDTPLVDALNNVWGNTGNRLCFIVLENNSVFTNTSYPRIWCVAEWDGQKLYIRPLVPVPVTLNGNVSLCQYLSITPSSTNITLDYIEGFKFADGSYASAYNLGNVSVDHIQLF